MKQPTENMYKEMIRELLKLMAHNIETLIVLMEFYDQIYQQGLELEARIKKLEEEIYVAARRDEPIGVRSLER